jgi:methylglutaconyl-CoA hydratase
MHTVNLTEHDHGIVEVHLNRPEIHNAFDDQMIAELTQTFKGLAEDESLRVVILSSEGRSFSAGADLNWMRRMADYSEEENYQDSMRLADCMHSIYSLPVPVIAQVQGAAFGGGVGLVACCDIAIASEHASFCLSEVKLGLIPAVISPYVIQAMGQRNSQRYFVTAEKFRAEQAQRLGLITDIVTADSLAEKVMELALLIATNGPEAVRRAKQLIRNVAGQDITTQLRHDTAKAIAELRASEQGKEGVAAFLSKRQPDWQEQDDV